MLSVIPLSIAGSEDAVSLTNTILGQAAGAMAGLKSVGIGIASVFLLFVIFQCVTSMLDGGKFQLKMLLPLLLYVLLCNFQLVTRPVTSFVGALQKACVSACKGSRKAMLEKFSNGAYEDGSYVSLYQAFISKQFEIDEDTAPTGAVAQTLKSDNPVDDALYSEVDEDGVSVAPPAGGEDGSGDGEKPKWWQVGKQLKNSAVQITASGIQGAIEGAVNKEKGNLFEEIQPGQVKKRDGRSVGDKLRWGFLGVVACVFQWVCDIVEFMVMAMGAVMTGVIVAFGPITWAFAIFPGNHRYVLSWFIRLCQFALYSPIVALCCSFGTALMYNFGSSGGGAASFLMFFGVMACTITILTATPSIASMVIEGASGAVSLSSGLQSVGAVLGTAGAFAAKMPGIAQLKNRYQAWTEKKANKMRREHSGEAESDDKQLNAMKANTDALNNLANGLKSPKGPKGNGNS